MHKQTTIKDLIGIEDIKLGFYQEARAKMEELRCKNLELEQKQQEIQAILDGIVDVMIVLSEDMEVISVNRVYHDYFSDSMPEGKYCFQALKGAQRPCSSCPARLALQKDQVQRDSGTYYCAGQNRFFDLLASPLQNSGEMQNRVLLFMRDVTLEKEYQTQFLQAEKMATIGLLAAGVAHEINNPLTSILGFTEGLQRRLPKVRQSLQQELAQDMQEYVGIILQECQRCQEIVQTLLSFSRSNSNLSQVLDLNTMVNECLKILRYKLKKCPEVQLDLHLQQEICGVSGDQAQLKQVVLNLLTNALDAVEPAGKIQVSTSQDAEESVTLMVQDNGPGIAKDHLDKVFDPFFTTKPQGQGTGIGLSTCYNIVRNHQGNIFICSEQGYGTKVYVRIPSQGTQS
ncbi:MAG: ATP-binding protein [Desulfohalobiaceae bacterium]